MKLITKLLAVCGAGMAVASASFATEWKDYKIIFKDLYAPDQILDPQTQSSSYSSWFDITSTTIYNPTPFVVGTSHINNASVSFSFLDEYWNANAIQVELDIQSLFSAPISTTFFSVNLSGSLISYLNSEGKLNYTVSITKGTALLFDGTLLADDIVTTNAVPDGGGTLILLAVGLACIPLLRKRTE